MKESTGESVSKDTMIYQPLIYPDHIENLEDIYDKTQDLFAQIENQIQTWEKSE